MDSCLIMLPPLPSTMALLAVALDVDGLLDAHGRCFFSCQSVVSTVAW